MGMNGSGNISREWEKMRTVKVIPHTSNIQHATSYISIPAIFVQEIKPCATIHYQRSMINLYTIGLFLYVCVIQNCGIYYWHLRLVN